MRPPIGTRPPTPAWITGARHSPPFGRASVKRREYPCGILPPDFVLENRGNGSDAEACSPLVMSVAVEKKKILTATKLSNRIVGTFSLERKLKAHASSGGNS